MLYPTIKKCKIKFLYSEFCDTNNHDITGQKSSICLLQHQNTKILCPEIWMLSAWTTLISTVNVTSPWSKLYVQNVVFLCFKIYLFYCSNYFGWDHICISGKCLSEVTSSRRVIGGTLSHSSRCDLQIRIHY